MMASEEQAVEPKEEGETAGQAATVEVDLQAGGEEGAEEQAKQEEEKETPQASAAPGGPQPPYDEDFNPFTEADLQHILHEEECSDPKEGWKFVSRSEYTEVWRKADPTKPVHLIKGFLHFPGIPPNTVSDIIHDVERRKDWDRQFPVIEVLETHKNFRVIYWLAKMPVAVADRDIVQFIRRQHDESTNTTYFLYRNATHPKAPPRKGLVRAETILSGVIIRPDPQDPNSTRASFLLQTDIKGWVPHFIVNTFATRAPKQWRDTLFNFYQKVQSEAQKSASKEEGEAGGGEGETGEEGKGKAEGGEGEGGAGGEEKGEAGGEEKGETGGEGKGEVGGEGEGEAGGEGKGEAGGEGEGEAGGEGEGGAGGEGEGKGEGGGDAGSGE